MCWGLRYVLGLGGCYGKLTRYYQIPVHEGDKAGDSVGPTKKNKVGGVQAG